MRLFLALVITLAPLLAQTSNYPSSLDTDTSLYVSGEDVKTTLSAAMAISDTVAVVKSPTGWQANMIATVDSEQMLVTAVTGNVLTVTRGIAGSSAAAHNSGKAFQNLNNAVHHNVVRSALKAIETALGPNLSNVATPNLVSAATYNFSPQTPGGTISSGVINTVNMAPCPKGVNGTDSNHWLYVSGGTGTAEAALIVGGTCTSEASSGTLLLSNFAYNHSGAWTIRSAAAGIPEAIQSSGGGRILVSSPTAIDLYARITVPTKTAIECAPNVLMTVRGWANAPRWASTTTYQGVVLSAIATVSGADRVLIKGCKIDQGDQNTGAAVFGSIVALVATTNSRVEGVTVINSGNHGGVGIGILENAATGNTVSDSVVTGTGAGGGSCSGGIFTNGTGNWITHNTVGGTDLSQALCDEGLVINGITGADIDNFIVGNTYTNPAGGASAAGVHVENTNRAVVTHNRLYNYVSGGGTGVWVGTVTAGYLSGDVIVTDNFLLGFNNGIGAGSDTSGSKGWANVIATNNHIIGGATCGVLLLASPAPSYANKAVIANNYISNNAQGGICAMSVAGRPVDDVTITDNIVEHNGGTTLAGIRLTGTASGEVPVRHLTLKDNSVRDQYGSFLSNAINASATSVIVSDGSLYPTGAFVLKVDSEYLSVSSRSGNTLTISARGYGGTTAASHSQYALCLYQLQPYALSIEYSGTTPIDAWDVTGNDFTGNGLGPYSINAPGLGPAGSAYCSSATDVSCVQNSFSSSTWGPNRTGDSLDGRSSLILRPVTPTTLEPPSGSAPDGSMALCFGCQPAVGCPAGGSGNVVARKESGTWNCGATTGSVSWVTGVVSKPFYDVRDYGCKGDNSTDNTTCLQAVIDAASASAASFKGAKIYLPRGVYRVNGLLTVGTAKVYLEGDGLGATYIDQRGTTSGTLYFNETSGSGNNEGGVANLSIIAGGVTNTALDATSGIALRVKGAIGHFLVQNVGIRNHATGLQIGYSNGVFIDHCYFQYAKNTGILIGDDASDLNNVEIHVSNSLLTNTGATGTPGTRPTGIRWKNGQGINLNNLDITAWTDGLLVQPYVNGHALYGYFENVQGDGNAGSGIRIDGTNDLAGGDLLIQSIVCTGCWAASNDEYGVLVYSGRTALNNPTIDDVRFIGLRARNNKYNGLAAAQVPGPINYSLGVNLHIQDSTIGGNSRGNSGVYSGIAIGPGVSNFEIQNNKLGLAGISLSPDTQAYGLVVLSGLSDNYQIVGNDFTHNLTGAMQDSGVGIHKFVSNNVGLDERFVVGGIRADTIASANVMSLPPTDVVRITGTSAVAELGPGTCYENRRVTLLTVDGAVTFSGASFPVTSTTSTQNVPLIGVCSIQTSSGSVTGATNANPIVIASTGHGLMTGDWVTIAGVTGNTAANGEWSVTKIDADHFSIPVAGNAAYVSGGTWTAAKPRMYLR